VDDFYKSLKHEIGKHQISNEGKTRKPTIIPGLIESEVSQRYLRAIISLNCLSSRIKKAIMDGYVPGRLPVQNTMSIFHRSLMNLKNFTNQNFLCLSIIY
jgi:hypothetical protein